MITYKLSLHGPGADGRYRVKEVLPDTRSGAVVIYSFKSG